MDMIIGPVLEIAKLAWGPIGRRIGYIKNLKKNMKELDKHDLFAARDDVLNKINSNKPNEVCNKWLENVKQLEDEVNAIREEFNEDKKCLIGWCPNIYSRMKLGKRVEDIIKEMTDQRKKRLEFDGEAKSRYLSVEKVLLQNVEVNSSIAAELTLQKILGFINDVKIRKIGIYGMGGMGKTRVMKLLNNQLAGSLKFEIIIWVTVSGEGNRRKVQNDIADRLKLRDPLNLPISNWSDDRLKAAICQRLERKKFLLLLDDVWQKIDLSDVGIPTLNQDNGCKVVLTTRDFGVCQQMETDGEIPMEKLSGEEAWSLFNEKVGKVPMSPDIEAIARDIVKKCGGLPLAIIVIGSSLRRRHDVPLWTNTLMELESPCTFQIKGMKKELFSCLRISYERLPDEFQRNLFLYCSLYPEDYEIVITELAEYFWLEGYMEGVDSIDRAWDKGWHMVSNLVDASLLERGNNKKHIKMHDMIRVFALNEASRFLVRTGKQVKHPPEEKEWLQSQKISLIGCSLVRLLERPNCSTLSTLLLQYNNQLTIIPDSFFECMHSLCILDLSKTEIKSLPFSLWTLVNLRGLYLKDCCKLEELPSQVGALTQLKVLHLGGSTAIKYLPIEVGELTRLKRLIVGFQFRNCSQNDGEDTKEWNMKLRVPTGIIPKLQLLEELSLYVYAFVENPLINAERFCAEKEQWDDESMEVVVDEVCRLEHLTYLDAYFPKVECLEHFLRHSKSVKETSWFRRFRFRVGTEITDRLGVYRSGQEWERCLVFNGKDSGFGTSSAAITETFARCSVFHLEDHRTARKLSMLGLASMHQLKECWVESCEKMETLFDGDALLPNLGFLGIVNLPELRSLYDGPLFPGNLCKLEYLELQGCKNLKKVFQLGIIRQLCSLEFIQVIKCSKMEEIIEIEEEEMSTSVARRTHNDRVILPNIKFFSLSYLPEFVSICRGFSNFEWPSLETIQIHGCPKLKSLSFLSNGTNILAPALKEISCERSWWEALEWEDNDIKQRLQPFVCSW